MYPLGYDLHLFNKTELIYPVENYFVLRSEHAVRKMKYD